MSYFDFGRARRPSRAPRGRGWTALAASAAALTLTAWYAGCSATQDGKKNKGDGDEDDGIGGAGGGTTSTGTGTTSQGGQLILDDGGMSDAAQDIPMNPCGTGCGPAELCDESHLGLDDDCNGLIDENCDCNSGQAHWCFKGDPSYHATAGCFDGTEKCTELGTWGDCIGGTHASDDPPCFSADASGCHPIQAYPFENVDLLDGTGTFSGGAISNSFTVTCPTGVDPCPVVTSVSMYQPIQSGEYQVHYEKTTATGTEECDFPLFVGAPGLRVELEWEHDLGSSGVDLDLHMHRPATTTTWAISGSTEDCGFANCTASAFAFPFGFGAPEWFPMTGTPPDPVAWHLDPDPSKNLCYNAPHGNGGAWQSLGKGCHNPRLDIDNVTCTPGTTNPQDINFCAPENINIDFPPKDQWIRVGVHYYSSHGLSYDVHPNIKIFCDGGLAAELGSKGFGDPETPLAFTPADSDTRFWVVADVMFKEAADECGQTTCIVQPIYQDATAKTPFNTNASAGAPAFGPNYPLP